MAAGNDNSFDEFTAREAVMSGALPEMHSDTLESWASDSRLFFRNFERFAAVVCVRSGCSFEIDQAELERVHSDWKAECEHWRTSGKMPKDTLDLNHTKMCGILLRSFCSIGYIAIKQSEGGQSEKGNKDRQPIYGRLAGRLLDGQGTYVAWLFVHYVMFWFEQYRSDKIDLFEARVSPEFEFEMASFLLSGLHSSDALYMLLLALFVRD